MSQLTRQACYRICCNLDAIGNIFPVSETLYTSLLFNTPIRWSDWSKSSMFKVFIATYISVLLFEATLALTCGKYLLASIDHMQGIN